MKGGLNTYGYVGGSPLNFFDFLGLSPEDVAKLLQSGNSTINRLTKNGNRADGVLGRYSKNAEANIATMKCWYFKDCSDFLDPNRGMRCFEQAGQVNKGWENVRQNGLDDNWDFRMKSTKDNSHSWSEARSSNPADPVVKVDPWYGNSSLVPSKR